jgi:transposase
MFVDFSSIRIFLRPGFTDMRKEANGLSIIVQEELELDTLSGNLFLFCNKRRNIFKALYWDRNGFCTWKKRLEKYRFPWPESEQKAREIGTEELKILLEGINFWHVHEEVRYGSVL